MNYGFILTLALTFGVVSSSYSEWGQTGHRVIGEIAEAHLSNTAKKQIDLLLEGHSLAFFLSIAMRLNPIPNTIPLSHGTISIFRLTANMPEKRQVIKEILQKELPTVLPN